MRFVGQGAETELPIERKPFQTWSKALIRRRFDAVYQRLYGRTYPENPVEFVTFKVRASLPERPFRLPLLARRKGRVSECIKGRRPAFSVLKKRFIAFTVYDRLKLYPGARIPGPAIIEEKESTIVIGEDSRARVDEFGFVWIDLA
jgi:N-methylhydantoinase A